MTLTAPDILQSDQRWVTPARFYRCSAEEASSARRRRAALRSQLGVIGSGSGASLDSVLATLIREGDAFAKWRESRDDLRNLHVVRRTGGTLVPVTPLSSRSQQRFRIDLNRSEDSQLEIWECGEEMEFKFPVFRLPLSSVACCRAKKIKEKLRSDVLLSFRIRNKGDRATIAVGINPSATMGVDIFRNMKLGLKQFGGIVSSGFARLSVELLNPVLTFQAMTGVRKRELHTWQYEDVRNSRLYQLSDLFRPAINSM